MAVPAVWICYTLVRGPLVVNPVTGDPWWYPYHFLNPHNPAGWPGVIGYSVGIAVVIAAVAWGVVGWGRRRGVTPS